MSTFARFAGLAAAVIVVAAAGTVLILGGGIGGDAAGAASPPSSMGVPTGAPSTLQATTKPSLPGEFTACVPQNSEFRTGTDAREVVSTDDGDVTIDRRRGFTWSGAITATDSRLSGTHYYSWDGDAYTLASGDAGQTAWSEGHRIDNEAGTWNGSGSGISWPDGTNWAGPVVLIGEGGYAGLTAVLVNADGPCFLNFRGIITEIPEAPVPFTED